MKKRCLALFLAMALTLTLFSFVPAFAQDNTVTIGVFSDSHNNSTGITNAFNAFSTLSGGNLDGVALVGDIIYINKTGITGNEYDTLLGNSTFSSLLSAGKISYSMGNHEFPEGSGSTYTEEARELFETKTGLKPENDVVLGGYHFISAGAMDYSPGTYTDREAWLRETIEKALAEDDEKPVFVSLHHPVPDTFYRTAANYSYSAGVYSDEFVEWIKSQPRLIVFSGHLHHPASDPKTIWQKENGATFIQTARVSGGNEAEDPYATKKGDERDSSAIMLSIDKTTNVVTIKRFHISSSGGTYFTHDLVFDIPSMAKGTPGSYNYTDARKNLSKVPYFSSDAVITTSSVTESSATLTFPAAIAGDSSENSIVQYYKIKIYDMDAAMLHGSEIIMSDFYKPTQSPTVTHSVFELQPNTSYRAEIIAETPFHVESKPITVDFTTTPPEFPDADYIGDVITKSIDMEGTQVADTNVPTGSGNRYASFWPMGKTHFIKFTFTVPTAGVYRVSSQLSSSGTTGKLTIGDTSLVKEVNTGAFATFKEKLWVDYTFDKAGDYDITIAGEGGGNSLCVMSLSIGKIRELSALDTGYSIKQRVNEKTECLNLGAPDNESSGMSTGVDSFITWSVTPEHTGTYRVVSNFNANSPGATLSMYNSSYADRSEDNLLGTKLVNTGYGADNDVEFDDVSMIAGQTYQFTLYSPSTNSNTPYVKYFLVEYKGELDVTNTPVTLKQGGYSGCYDTNIPESMSYPGLSKDYWISYKYDVPVDAIYKISVYGGVNSGVTLTASTESGSVTKYLEKTAEHNNGNLAWNTKKTFDIGTVSLKKGERIVKISLSPTDTGTMYLNNVILTSVGEYELITDEITVSALDYTKQEHVANSHISTGNGAIGLAQKNYRLYYDVEVGAGNYDLSIFYGNYSGDSAATVTIDGVKLGTFPLEYVGGYINGTATKKLTSLRLSEGKHTIMFSWDGTGSTWYSLENFTLSAMESPYLEMYSGDSAGTGTLTNVLTEGAMTARALLPKSLDGKNVTMIFAIYEGDSLYAVKETNITAKKNSAIAVTLDGIDFADGKTYTSKVFFWDTLSNIKPYCMPLGELTK